MKKSQRLRKQAKAALVEVLTTKERTLAELADLLPQFSRQTIVCALFDMDRVEWRYVKGKTKDFFKFKSKY